MGAIGECGSLAEYHHGEGYSYTEFAQAHPGPASSAPETLADETRWPATS